MRVVVKLSLSFFFENRSEEHWELRFPFKMFPCRELWR